MKTLLLMLLLIAQGFAHLGEEASGVEAHSVVETILDNPTTITVVGLVFLMASVALYSFFPAKSRYRQTTLAVIVVVVAIFALVLAISLLREPPMPKSFHMHADFKVYLNGLAYNFSQEKYMSTNQSKLSDLVHLHDLDGNIIHYHSRNITLAEFFSTLNMNFNSTCFVVDNTTSYCNNGTGTLRMFVRHTNGTWQQNSKMEKYVAEDTDQILITYGPISDNVSEQEATVTDKACIQSEKCPERGMPTDSSCAGDVCTV